jgi:hypothetical protein
MGAFYFLKFYCLRIRELANTLTFIDMSTIHISRKAANIGFAFPLKLGKAHGHSLSGFKYRTWFR